MLFLELGTALSLDDTVESMEIGHAHFRHGRSYEDYLEESGRNRPRNQKWRKAINKMVEQLKALFVIDYVVVVGGNVPRLRARPEGASRCDNPNAFAGGVRL